MNLPYGKINQSVSIHRICRSGVLLRPKTRNTAANSTHPNGTHAALFAIRRLGKTGLIKHVLYPYNNSIRFACIYLDILSTQNLTDFTNQLATAVYNRFPAKKSLGKKIKEMIYYQTGIEQPYYEVYDKFLMSWLRLH